MTIDPTLTDVDPKGLIQEAYRIEGIVAADCRTIFLDWALSLPEKTEPALALRVLLEEVGVDHVDHPMTRIIQDGLATTPVRRRRKRPVRRGAA